MSRRNNHSLRSEALHNLQVAKRWTRWLVYPGVTILIPIDIFVLHFPLLQSVLSHVGGYIVAALGIEFGYRWGERVRQQAEYPNVLRTQLGSPPTLRDACHTAVNVLVQLLGADAAILGILQRDSDSPEVIVSHGLPPGAIRFTPERAASLAQYYECLRNGSIVIQPLPSSHILASTYGRGRIRVLVPVVAFDKAMGLLIIYGPRKRTELRDRTLLKGLGGALGLLLDNIRLYDHEYQAILHILTSALDQRDRVTDGHSRRVADLSLVVARELGIKGEDLLDIERAAILHDIGKLAVPDAILSKPGSLTSDEWVEMRRHPDVGYQLVRDVPFLSRAADIIRGHHERFDGTGYPSSLKGEDIPMGARIFAVVDAYDAMTSDRPYRLALSHEEALAEIRRETGTQFDPVVVAPFFAAVRKGLIGPGMPAKAHDRLFRIPGGNGPTPSPEVTHVPAS